MEIEMNAQEELKQALEDYATLLPELEAMVQQMEKLTKKILRYAKIVLKEKTHGRQSTSNE